MPGTSRTPRERMVYAAVQRLRQYGVVGTGLRAVVADADAPWGSLRHYFPGGKGQLLGEALAWAGDFAAARVESYLTSTPAPTPSGLFRHTVQAWIEELERRGFARGCPAAAAVIDGADTSESIRLSASQSLETWRRPITGALTSMGAAPERADELSTLMLATLEGAIILARAGRSSRPLRQVAEALEPALVLQPVDHPS